MAANKPLPLLGRLAVNLKMITMDQLAEATREQGRVGEATPLGEILLHKGFLDRNQLAKLVHAQKQVIAKARAKRAAEAASAAPILTEAPVRQTAPEPVAPKTPPAAAPAPAPVSSSPPAAAPTPAPVSASPPATAPAAAPAPAPASPAPQRTATAEAEAAPHPPLLRLEDLATPTDADHEALQTLLREAVAQGASDVHLHTGASVSVRVAGEIRPLHDQPLGTEEAERMVLAALTPEQRARLAAHGEIDSCRSFEGIGRFRANFYRQHRGFDAVFRYISDAPPTLAELGLPPGLARFTNYHQGMVVVTGPAGCGKSSTLAALVNLINEERSEHVLTIEDPIEFVHTSKRCLVNQRSVEHHTRSFARALRAALREDPDVIVIGELRDLETISLALSAAETGHFVLATLHTDNSIRTINRLVGSFPADQQDQIRTMLSESLRAVVSQRLLPRADGQGRIPALETLVVTRAVSNLIRENKTFQIQSILQTGAAQGMALLDQSIRELVKSGSVRAEDAAHLLEDTKAKGLAA